MGQDRQNLPVLTSAQTVGNTTTITGRLNSTPSTTFAVRFFSSPSGNEGKTYIGFKEVSTDAGGGNTGIFTTNQSVPPGRRITATATDPDGNTSEFSAAREVTAP